MDVPDAAADDSTSSRWMDLEDERGRKQHILFPAWTTEAQQAYSAEKTPLQSQIIFPSACARVRVNDTDMKWLRENYPAGTGFLSFSHTFLCPGCRISPIIDGYCAASVYVLTENMSPIAMPSRAMPIMYCEGCYLRLRMEAVCPTCMHLL